MPRFAKAPGLERGHTRQGLECVFSLSKNDQFERERRLYGVFHFTILLDFYFNLKQQVAGLGAYPLYVVTVLGSILTAFYRVWLMPIDTLKTISQVREDRVSLKSDWALNFSKSHLRI